jgi:hypothetical protein
MAGNLSFDRGKLSTGTRAAGLSRWRLGGLIALDGFLFAVLPGPAPAGAWPAPSFWVASTVDHGALVGHVTCVLVCMFVLKVQLRPL